MTDTTTISFATVYLLLLIPFTIYLVHQYAEPSVRLGYKVVIFLSWYVGFIGIGLLPIDLGTATKIVPKYDFISALWWTIYILSMILSYIILPFLMEYAIAGEFNVMYVLN